MNIAVYCGSNFGTNPHFEAAAKVLGKWIGESGHSLVYGGSKVGLMGTVADAVLAHGGKVYGVMPHFLSINERVHDGITSLEMVETMSERKNRMMALADAYVALPGGPGTLEEISEVISLARVKQHNKPCVLYNIDGFYDLLEQFYKQMEDNSFLRAEDFELVCFAKSFDELKQHVTQVKVQQ